MFVLKNSVIVSVWTMVSRWLGFARDLLIANKLGVGLESDAFFIALQLPNLFRRLLGEGAFNVAFVPLLARELGKGHAEAKAFAEVVMSWLLLTLTALSVAGILLMPALVTLVTTGGVQDPVKFELMVALGRITFPYVMMICMAAFMGAVCNTAGRFAAYAMVPSLLNLAFIVGLFALPGIGVHPAYAAAWSVPLGGMAQVLYMVWEMRRAGFGLRLVMPRRHPGLSPLLVRMGPAALGVGVLQLAVLIDTGMASWAAQGSVTVVQMANRFYQFPLSTIGIAVATVLLPHLSVLLGQGDKRQAAITFMDSLMGCLTLAAGAAVGMFLLSTELTVTALAHGKTSVDAATLISLAMMGYVVGLPGYILTKVTAPAFFANQDTRSPVKASAIALAVNFVCNVAALLACRRLGMLEYAPVGIALSTAAGGYTNAALQWHWLKRQGVFVIADYDIRTPLLKMALVGGVMAAALLAFKAVLPYRLEAPLLLRVAWLGAAIAVAGAVFAAGVSRTGLFDIRAFLKQARRRKGGKTDALADVTAIEKESA
jgi:putative peptidoglycan lipid II flippase